MPDFFMRTRQKIGGGGVIPNFWCVLKEYYCKCRGGGGRGELCPFFFMRTRKGGLYPNFWCVIKEYYRECGGGLCQIFMRTRKGEGCYTQFFGVYSKNITASGGGGGLMPDFFMRNRKKIRKGGGLYPNFWCVLKEYYCECGVGGCLCQIFVCILENY